MQQFIFVPRHKKCWEVDGFVWSVCNINKTIGSYTLSELILWVFFLGQIVKINWIWKYSHKLRFFFYRRIFVPKVFNSILNHGMCSNFIYLKRLYLSTYGLVVLIWNYIKITFDSTFNPFWKTFLFWWYNLF